ncbi:hypothetical protein [Sphingopyxis macrogoltabida]|uniref:Uncharacterized protein n=1 Tax=Sphingopyxis macrogoltabida TaxID=33050 RepID=A0AAC9AX83_SPHMC|nr:hypothetical protein [Sphingopyxis macrogoltabida]ALJ15368.1 hypothetical protein LH19_21035 [Sphingopyxis macrogoltabida]AMU91617.1 hypothetical protein ATM17_21615 [Sphingopyxis macrogoltabida]
MIERIGSLGAGIALVLLAIVTIAAALSAGYFAATTTKKNAAGWVAGLAVFLLLALAFGPSMEALRAI